MARSTVLLVLLALGCGTPAASHTPGPSGSASASDTPASFDAGATPMFVDASAPIATVDASTVVLSWRSSIIFSGITGRTGDQTAAIFTPTAQAIEGCRGATGGKLVLKLHADHGRVVAEPQAGSSIDPAAKQCVLDALSSVHVDDSSNMGVNAPVKPMGFTSMLTIEW